MASPTAIEVSVDSIEYSRYEEDRNTITASVVLSGGTSYTAEEITVELVKARRNRDAVVATTTLTVTGTAPQILSATFLLTDVVDQDELSLIRFGKYLVRATSVTDPLIIGESADFDISVITLDRFKRDYLFGIDLKSTEVLQSKLPIMSLTGVTVQEVSKGHPTGFGTLTYNYTTGPEVRLLSWRGGPSVTVNRVGTFILKAGGALGSASSEYITVRVSSLGALPTTATAEELLIEKATMEDVAIREYIKEAIAWVENDYLCTYIEPTNITTDIDPSTIQFTVGVNTATPVFTDTDYDFLVPALTYYPLTHGNGWPSVKTPYNQLQRVDSLFGAVANNRIIDVDLEWVEISKVGGVIQLVPFSQGSTYVFTGFAWLSIVNSGAEMPNFWHFNAIAGTRHCWPDIRELVGKKAAIRTLTAAGLAFRPGIGSQSLSRDGVSQSVSYIASAKYGIYTAAITALEEWLEKSAPLIKAKYRGITWGVL